mgnify:CR=1 FL=1
MLIHSFEYKKIVSTEDVAKIFQEILRVEDVIDQDKEHLWVMGLTVSKLIKYIELVSLGSLTETLSHPREIFRFAIMQSVDSIIAVHNHPGGDVSPSIPDINMMNRIKEAGKILGIHLIDSIIVKDDRYYSFLDNNLLK